VVGNWFVTAISFARWWHGWQLAGGVTVARFWAECRKVIGNTRSLRFLVAIMTILLLPFNIAFDLAPPELIPLQLPLALTSMLLLTCPVSFLVLGPSRPSTVEVCSRLVWRFAFLRPAAAINPRELGKLAQFSMGPSGNIWINNPSQWQLKVARLIADTPLVVFDARTMNHATCWELQHLLLSPDLPKVTIVGPVQGRAFQDLLRRFGAVPVVDVRVVTKVIDAACGSRNELEAWYDRRRRAIIAGIESFQPTDEGLFGPDFVFAARVEQEFIARRSALIALHRRAPDASTETDRRR